MFREFGLHTGNLEVKKLNAGGGFKTNFSPVTNQLGDEDAVVYRRGGSKYVKA